MQIPNHTTTVSGEAIHSCAQTTTTSSGLPKLAYNRADAARIISMSKASLDRLVDRGLIRPSRATGRPLFSLEELQRFLRETTGI